MVTAKHTKPSLKKGRSAIQTPSPVNDDDEDEYILKTLSDDVIEQPKSQIIQKNTSIESNNTNSNFTIVDKIKTFLENHVKLDEEHLNNIRDTVTNTNNTQNDKGEIKIDTNSDKDSKEKKEQVILRKPAGSLSKKKLQKEFLEGEENKVSSALSQLNWSHNNTNESKLEESQKYGAPFLQDGNRGNDSKTTVKEIDEKSISLKPVSSNDNATRLHESVDQPDRNRSEITKRMESLKAEKILQNDNLTQIIENMIEQIFKEKEREKDKLISLKAESVDLNSSTTRSHQNDSQPEVKAETDDEGNRTTLKRVGVQLSSSGNDFNPISHQHDQLDKAYNDSNKVSPILETEGSNYSNSEQPFQNKATNLNETSNNLDEEIELKTPFEKLKHRIKMLDNELEKAEQELKEHEAEDHVKEVLLFTFVLVNSNKRDIFFTCSFKFLS